MKADRAGRGVVVVAVLAAWLLVAGCSGGSGDEAESTPGPSGVSTTLASVSTSVRPQGEESDGGERSDVPVSVAVGRALKALGLVEDRVAVPDEAVGCVTAKLAADGALVAQLEGLGADAEVPPGVMDLAAVCMVELRAIPAFVDGLEAQLPGGLSDGQRRCVAEGFAGLDPAVLDAAIAESLGASEQVDEAAEIAKMVEGCGVDVER